MSRRSRWSRARHLVSSACAAGRERIDSVIASRTGELFDALPWTDAASVEQKPHHTTVPYRHTPEGSSPGDHADHTNPDAPWSPYRVMPIDGSLVLRLTEGPPSDRPIENPPHGLRFWPCEHVLPRARRIPPTRNWPWGPFTRRHSAHLSLVPSNAPPMVLGIPFLPQLALCWQALLPIPPSEPAPRFLHLLPFFQAWCVSFSPCLPFYPKTLMEERHHV